MSDDDADDFAARDQTEVTLEHLVRGVSRREVAEMYGVRLSVINERVAQAVRERSGEVGSPRERLAVIDAGLDDIIERAYDALESDRETTAPLLEVLLGAHRLRLAITPKVASDA